MERELVELFIPLTAIVLGSLMFLIPIAGLTARFALKPIMEALARNREASAGGTARELGVLEQRVALLEQQYQTLESNVDRIAEFRDFERRLSTPPDHH